MNNIPENILEEQIDHINTDIISELYDLSEKYKIKNIKN